MAGIADIIGGLLGKESMARQFFMWNVAAAVASTGMDPFLTELSNTVNANHPLKPLPPADLADMAVRGIIDHGQASGEAAKSGVNSRDFDLMVSNTGEPPSLIDMLQLLRRGKVDRAAVVRAIKQSRVKDEWIDTILMLGVQPPSPADILRATLQGQTDIDTGKRLYEQLGGDPDFFQLMLDAEGSAPTPTEAAEMANRGIIPWEGTGPDAVSFQQAFLEGPWRNKWLAAFRKSAEYFPPPRTITAMYNSGALSRADAADLLARQGLAPALVGAYLSDASKTKTVKVKELAESTIATLYQDQAIDDVTATELLRKLTYTNDEISYILLTWQMAREQKFKTTAIGTVHTQYINHKIGADDASVALDKLGVPASQRDSLIALWSMEAETKVTLLTPAEIRKAVTKVGNMTPEDGINRLLQHGYSEEDALIYMDLG